MTDWKTLTMIFCALASVSNATAADVPTCQQASERLVTLQKEFTTLTDTVGELCYLQPPKKLADAIDQYRALIAAQTQLKSGACAKPAERSERKPA